MAVPSITSIHIPDKERIYWYNGLKFIMIMSYCMLNIISYDFFIKIQCNTIFIKKTHTIPNDVAHIMQYSIKRNPMIYHI